MQLQSNAIGIICIIYLNVHHIVFFKLRLLSGKIKAFGFLHQLCLICAEMSYITSTILSFIIIISKSPIWALCELWR